LDVVIARLDAPAHEACLSHAERQRARRFRFERDRRRFVAGRARLRELLGARLGVQPAAVELAYGSNGKPRLARGGWHFSVSHCDEVALFAFSAGSEIGVDIEAIRAVQEADAIAAQCFSRREYAAYSSLESRDKPLGFLECWTRKEAFVKALGEGLSMPLDRFDVSLAPGWQVHSFSPLPGFIAALACHG
jgi:4'-phosphopantetheinyl transferase